MGSSPLPAPIVCQCHQKAVGAPSGCLTPDLSARVRCLLRHFCSQTRRRRLRLRSTPPAAISASNSSRVCFRLVYFSIGILAKFFSNRSLSLPNTSVRTGVDQSGRSSAAATALWGAPPPTASKCRELVKLVMSLPLGTPSSFLMSLPLGRCSMFWDIWPFPLMSLPLGCPYRCDRVLFFGPSFQSLFVGLRKPSCLTNPRRLLIFLHGHAAWSEGRGSVIERQETSSQLRVLAKLFDHDRISTELKLN